MHAAVASHSGHLRPSILQPHLYELHSPLRPPSTSDTMTSSQQQPAVATSVTTATNVATSSGGSSNQQQPSTIPASSSPATTNAKPSHTTSLNLDLDSHEALHEHIYHAYGDWDNTYDPTKLMLAGHKFPGGTGGSFSSELLGPAPPLMTGSSNPFLHTDPFAAGPGSLDSLSSGASGLLQFGAGNTTLACSLQGAAAVPSASSISTLHQGAAGSPANSAVPSSMTQASSAAASSLLSTAVLNHHSANIKSDHVHTEACFKNMKMSGPTGAALSTSGAAVFNTSNARHAFSPNQSPHTGIPLVKTDGLNTSALGVGLPASGTSLPAASLAPLTPSVPSTLGPFAPPGSASTSVAAASIASLGMGMGLSGLSEHCLKHNPFLHAAHHAPFSTGAPHPSATTLSSVANNPGALPTHPVPMKLTPELIRSMKEGTAPTTQPISSQPIPPPPPGAPHTCTHHVHGAATGVNQLAGQHNLHTNLLDPNVQVGQNKLYVVSVSTIRWACSFLPQKS